MGDGGISPAPPLRLVDRLSDGAHGPSLILLSGREILFPNSTMTCSGP
jgi:hypothetical protein